jgi:hypothetical protein
MRHLRVAYSLVVIGTSVLYVYHYAQAYEGSADPRTLVFIGLYVALPGLGIAIVSFLREQSPPFDWACNAFLIQSFFIYLIEAGPILYQELTKTGPIKVIVIWGLGLVFHVLNYAALCGCLFVWLFPIRTRPVDYPQVNDAPRP